MLEEYVTDKCTKPYKTKWKIFTIIIILIIVFSFIGALLSKFYSERSNPYGMPPQNVGSIHTITSSENYIFHSFASDGLIRRIDKKTKETIRLDFCGDYINVMGNSLYFTQDDKIYTCDLDGKNMTEIPFIVPGYPDPDIVCLYAIKKGLLFRCYDSPDCSYYLLPYNSKYPVNMKNIPETSLFTKDGYYAALDGYLLIFNFEEPGVATTYFVDADLDPYNVYYENNTVVYAIDNTIYVKDIVTGMTKILYTARNEIIDLSASYNGYIYFYLKEEKSPGIPLNAPFYVINPEGVPTRIFEGMLPSAINFLNDKLFFYDAMPSKYSEKRYNYMCNLDGSELTRIN